MANPGARICLVGALGAQLTESGTPATAIDTFSRIALDRLYIEGFVVEPTTMIDPPAPVPGSAG